jgi:hypothetical protein
MKGWRRFCAPALHCFVPLLRREEPADRRPSCCHTGVIGMLHPREAMVALLDFFRPRNLSALRMMR